MFPQAVMILGVRSSAGISGGWSTLRYQVLSQHSYLLGHFRAIHALIC